jgi:hypothetical protein
MISLWLSETCVKVTQSITVGSIEHHRSGGDALITAGWDAQAVKSGSIMTSWSSNSTGHAHAQECHDGNHDQQADGDTNTLIQIVLRMAGSSNRATRPACHAGRLKVTIPCGLPLEHEPCGSINAVRLIRATETATLSAAVDRKENPDENPTALPQMRGPHAWSARRFRILRAQAPPL